MANIVTRGDGDIGQRVVRALTQMTGSRPELGLREGLDIGKPFRGENCQIGYSQFNELLLTLGYNRVRRSFFQYLVDETRDYKRTSALRSIEDLEQGVERFLVIAVLLFGNVRHAYKRLSEEPDELEYWLQSLQPEDPRVFQQRHDAIHDLVSIPSGDTYYLEYLAQRDIEERYRGDPDDVVALADKQKMDNLKHMGRRNYEAYLASDHLDVYIATSMRERHEYVQVSEWVERIFSYPRLRSLKLRWFDPTQSCCENRVDKGLVEGLMLKRAKCTVYFAQESDTLGKDSELASTLAQGKVVIAYVPSILDGDAEAWLQRLVAMYPDKSEYDLVLEQLRAFAPDAAWRDAEVRNWLTSPESFDRSVAIARLASTMRAHYDRRAEVLSTVHPLGIQVNLDTGVANGVLVVRSTWDCAELIYRVVTRTMKFRLERSGEQGSEYLELRESVSGCVYRVVTGDAMLTNTFWNFYRTPVA